MINSYDLFDTLIGRICYRGDEVFRMIEVKTGLTQFTEQRKMCESETLEDTYSKLSSVYNIDLSGVMQLELDIEYTVSIPIKQLIYEVQQDDIIVSDMYLNEMQLRKLINKHRCLQNPIYVSSNGKSSGRFWRKHPVARQIRVHKGDNYLSDFIHAKQAGIPALHINTTELNDAEELITSISKELAYCIRAVRLATVASEEDYSYFFSHLVLPVGILLCIWLNSLGEKHAINHIVFLSRDGYWLHELYSILFPKQNISYKYFSREYINNKDNQDKFITSLYRLQTPLLIVDLNGSGKTVSSLLHQIPNAYYAIAFCYSASSTLHPKCFTLVSTEHKTKQEFDMLEDIFMAPHGTVTYNGELSSLENNPEICKEYIKCFTLFKEYITIYKSLIDIKYEHSYTNDVPNILYQIIKHNVDWERVEQTFTHVPSHGEPLDVSYSVPYYSQIEQDKYYIEHVAKFKLGGTFVELGAYDGITGSNTYTLESYLGWTGILVECNPKQALLCKQNRHAYVCDRAIHRTSDIELEFLIPEGMDIAGGKEQLAGFEDYLREESRSYFARSYSRYSTIKVKTININNLLESRNMFTVDYMSIDLEGYELEVLKSIDFSRFDIKFFTIEHGNTIEYKTEIHDFLVSKGYHLHRENKWDDEYSKNQ